MSKGGPLTRKPQKWATTQLEKLFGGFSPWFITTVAVVCICTSIYALQILITKGEDRTDLKELSGVLNELPLAYEPPPPFTQRFLPRSESFFDWKSPPPLSGAFYDLKVLPPGARKPRPMQTNTVPSPLYVDAVSPSEMRKTTDITRIVFGIGAAAKSWDHRKGYIRLWWRLNKGARGFVWLDTPVDDLEEEDDFPILRISADTSNFRSESRAGVRMFRIISETLRLGLPDIDWLVLGDDDTVFFPENLVKVLSKYDHNQMFYVGSNSESNVQNLIYSYSMAFGGGGFAISYPLAKELSSMEDDCLARYPQAYGSDDRIHACMSELGVALTNEPGFHQMDIHGNPFGLLAAHPVNPLVSLHHMDAMDAFFPDNGTRQEAVAHLVEAATVDQASLLQQSMCYCQKNKQIWSISVSWGYAVQIYKGYLAPRELEIPVRTFNSVLRKTYETEFSFNTRELPQKPCEKPTVYYMSWVRQSNEHFESEYKKENEKKWTWTWWRSCDKELEPINAVQQIRVTKEPVPDSWFQAPRRSCCQLTGWSADTVDLHLGACQPGQSIATLSPGWD